MYCTEKKPEMASSLKQGFDISRFSEPEYIKDYLIYSLINIPRNRERLEKMPYRRYLDLAVIYSCAFRTGTGDKASIKVTNDHMRLWGLTEEELFETASENTPMLLPGRITPLPELLSDLLADIDGCDKAVDMYICSNTELYNGAAGILYDGLLKDFSRSLGRDLIILPSSIHEVILIPDNGGYDYGSLESLVDYVNKTQVADNEVLSDKIYLYNRNNNEISINYVTIL